MLYVRQSLGPNEKLVHIGRFHWSYTAAAISWAVIGLAAAYFILHVALHMDVQNTIDQRLPNLPEGMQKEAWNRVIDAKGGLIQAVLNLHIAARVSSMVAFLMGVFMCARMLIIMAVTEIAVTNQRMIYKTGLIARYIGEISVDRIEGVNVVQSILGRILGYGRVIVRGMGVGEVSTPPIAEPIRFRRAIDKARTL